MQTLLGKQVNDYVIHPAGRIHNDDVDYLVTKFSSGKKIKLVAFVLDSKHTYLSNYLLLDNHQSDKYRRNVSITSEPTFITKREKENAKNEVVYTRNGYAFNKASNNFTEVLNDSNEDQKKSNEIINPVDTLPSTNKFSGDYITDRKNFISIRDGKDALTYMFFIHFEKNGADCTGELKGEMTLTTETNAVYKESGDACVINFKFSGNNVSVKEEGNCGNHRGINCPYDFTFRKKKNK